MWRDPVAADRVTELRETATNGAIDIDSEIARLESKSTKLLRETYARLSPWQKAQVARHPQRPRTLDLVPLIYTTNYDDFIEMLRDSRTFNRYQKTIIDRPTLNSTSCDVPHEVAIEARWLGDWHARGAAPDPPAVPEGRVAFRIGDAASLPYQEDSFDLVAVNRRETVKVWRNVGLGMAEAPAAIGQWAAVRLTQPGPNRDAIWALGLRSPVTLALSPSSTRHAAACG